MNLSKIIELIINGLTIEQKQNIVTYKISVNTKIDDVLSRDGSTEYDGASLYLVIDKGVIAQIHMMSNDIMDIKESNYRVNPNEDNKSYGSQWVIKDFEQFLRYSFDVKIEEVKSFENDIIEIKKRLHYK